MIDQFFKYLDNEISLNQFEEWIYNNPKIENIIGENNYNDLININFNSKNSDIDIQNFILSHIANEHFFCKLEIF